MLNNVVKNAMIAHGYGQAIHVCCMCKHYTLYTGNYPQRSWVQNLNRTACGTVGWANYVVPTNLGCSVQTCGRQSLPQQR